jgi:membrane protein DedA with SNARE-associated domain
MSLNETIAFLVRHGYTVLFAWVLVEQIGLPLPSVPLLLAAGALAGTGRLNLLFASGLAVAAALLSDLLWYEMGRRRGVQVLQFLCRISLEPDSCVRRTEDVFARHGARSLLLAKFIPGLNTAAPPLAGIFRMRLARFLCFDALGAMLWVGAFVGLGYAFSDQLERMGSRALALGSGLLALMLATLAGWITWKYFKRQRFLRELRIARITPEELKRKLDAGEDVVIVDLRHSLDFEAKPHIIPGAFHMEASDLDEMHGEIPRDRDVVLYCT